MKHELELSTPSELEIRIQRVFDAPRPRVFDCWTKPELLKRWMTGPPGWVFAVCEIDLRVGGRFRFAWKGSDGAELASGGVYKEVVVPERVVNTEKFDQDWTGGETLGTLEMSEKDRQTFVTVNVLYSSTTARDGAMASGMDKGMSASFDSLDQFLNLS